MPHEMTRYIILNGPAHSGKSTIAQEICRFMRAHNLVCMEDSFAAPIKHLIATAMGEQYNRMPKDSPVAILSGKSVREFVIDQSDHMKEQYGEDILGRLLVNRMLRINPKPAFIIADSSNDQDELDAIPNVLLIRVERPGYEFKSDSRQWLQHPHYRLVNDGMLVDLWVSIEKLGLWLLEQRNG